MAYQVTYTTTFQSNAVPYDEWLESIDANVVLLDYEYIINTSPKQVVEERNQTMLDPAQGFISEQFTKDGNVNTLVQLWDSQEAYQNAFAIKYEDSIGNPGTISCSANSNIITGTGTSFTSLVDPTDLIQVKATADLVALNGNVIPDKNIFTLGQVASIESDTSLTLYNANPYYGMTDVEYIITNSMSITDYLNQLYAKNYIVSTEITTANV